MRVLMVCLGNICRSPLAEGILRHKALEKGLEIEIDSAGTSHWHAGENPDPRSVSTARKFGIDISKLVARQFTIQDFDDFDYILVMDQLNYMDVLKLARNQKDIEKVHYILNFLSPESNQHVPDPYFGGEDGFTQVYNMLDQACEKFLETVNDER